VAWSLAYGLRVLGRFEQSLAVADQTLALPSLREPWSVRLKGLRAALLVNAARWEEARDAAAQAEVESQRVGDRFGVGWALFALGAVHSRYDMDLATASRTFERATVVLADEPDATDLRLLLLSNNASTLSNLGRGPEALRVLGQALALAERAGTPQRLATLRVQAAEIAFTDGRWDYAVAELGAAHDLPPHNPTRIMVLGLTTLLAVHRDDRSAVAARLREIEELALPSASVSFADTLLAARALAAERDGLPDEALTLLLQALDPASTREFPLLTPYRCEWLTDVVRLALATGDEVTAVVAARACAAEADRRAVPWSVAATQYCRGLVEADHALLLSAADSYGRLAYPLYRARALEDAAVLLARSGDTASARRAYAGALEIYTDLEADWDIARADGRLRPLGIRRGVRGPRRRPAHGWQALTPTEVKIAHLVEAGKSNPDIAADLFLSRNTVQTHVSHILSKLNVRSRVDIAREAMTQR
jgi:DNA-binding CsgD family transcriptional regulator